MANKPPHSAKSTTKKTGKRRLSNKARLAKFERYRNRIGKPNGPGKPGNKAGKNKIH